MSREGALQGFAPRDRAAAGAARRIARHQGRELKSARRQPAALTRSKARRKRRTPSANTLLGRGGIGQPGELVPSPIDEEGAADDEADALVDGLIEQPAVVDALAEIGPEKKPAARLRPARSGPAARRGAPLPSLRAWPDSGRAAPARARGRRHVRGRRERCADRRRRCKDRSPAWRARRVPQSAAGATSQATRSPGTSVFEMLPR